MKENPRVSVFPRSLATILVSVGGLAVFLIIASLLLVSNPIGSTVRGYFYGVDSSRSIVFPLPPFDKTTIDHLVDRTVNEFTSSSQSAPAHKSPIKENSGEVDASSLGSTSSKVENKHGDTDKGSDDTIPVTSSEKEVSGTNKQVDDNPPAISTNNEAGGTDKHLDAPATSSEKESGGMDTLTQASLPVTLSENNNTVGTNQQPEDTTPANLSSDSKGPSLSSMASDANKTDSERRGCDLYHGNWFFDPEGPLYTNNSCPVITQMQNCQGNGRPDKEYESWRWRPSECDLPRFNAKKFLELMRGKTLAFIGDSVARNQFESMLCLLWQAEAPKNRGNRRMQRWYFRSTNTMIIRIWSSWLIHRTSEPIDIAPESVVKLHLDAPDEGFMQYITQFDVIVLSSGHWFAKQSVYMLNNEVVGGQLWWPDKSKPMKVNNVEAFGISVETILTSMATHPNYTGLTIVRSFSPDHYEGGAWNTGGSCTGKVMPLAPGEFVENRFTDIMHKKQVMGFERAVTKRTNKSKLKLIDITDVFGLRHDGHPGPYRSPDPNKITKRGPDGKPPPQDCLHWCMPGPVDTWNELVLEIITREFEGNRNSAS